MNQRALFLVIVVLLSSCASQTDETITVLEQGPEETYIVHIKKVKDTLTLKLSDIAEDFEFVPLETKEECLLGYASYYVTNNYILAKKEGYGILQFKRNGEFLRKILSVGKGPNEYLNAGWAIDEDNDILYLTDLMKKNYILCFDLKTGEFLQNIPKAIPSYSNSISYTSDDMILLVPAGPFKDYKTPMYLYWQNLKGQLIHGIEAPSNLLNPGDPKSFYVHKGIPRYQFILYDTVYSVHSRKMIPYLVFDFEKENPLTPTLGRNTIVIQFESSRYISFIDIVVSELKGRSKSPSANTYYYTLDKKSKKVFQQGRVYFDPSHHYSNAYVVEDEIQIQSNGIFHYAYQVSSLIEYGELALDDPEFKGAPRSKLQNILGIISEYDNPVLLIGKAK